MASRIDALVIGCVTVDLVPGGRVLGGTVSYAAPTLAAFGHRVGVLTSAAKDEPLLEPLRDFAELVALPSERSLTYENVYCECGRRQYVRATARPIRLADAPREWLSARYVHLGPLAAELDPLELARGFPQATVMLTMQGMMRRWDADGLVKFRRWFDEDALRLIDIVVYSEEDVRQYPQLTARARALCRHLVVTNGRHGGTYFHDGGAMVYPSLDVAPLDLTGAGDVFAASLLGSLAAVDGDVSCAVPLAGRLAARSVTRTGIESAPTRDEIERELQSLRRG